MTINYLDNNIVVQYIQIFLQETSGVVLKDLAKNRTLNQYDFRDFNPDSETSIITLKKDLSMNSKIKVSGYFDNMTYIALSIYMALNYPNEGFPWYWYEYEDPITQIKEWRHIEYSKAEDDKANEALLEQYRGLNPDMNYHPLLCYILQNNIELISTKTDIVQIDDRILSYIMDEVVSENSDPDEIFRMQKIIYPNGLPKTRTGIYDDILKEKVKEFQLKVIDYFKNKNIIDIGLHYGIFYNLKATGYIDPATEYLIKKQDSLPFKMEW